MRRGCRMLVVVVLAIVVVVVSRFIGDRRSIARERQEWAGYAVEYGHPVNDDDIVRFVIAWKKKHPSVRFMRTDLGDFGVYDAERLLGYASSPDAWCIAETVPVPADCAMTTSTFGGAR